MKHFNIQPKYQQSSNNSIQKNPLNLFLTIEIEFTTFQLNLQENAFTTFQLNLIDCSLIRFRNYQTQSTIDHASVFANSVRVVNGNLYSQFRFISFKLSAVCVCRAFSLVNGLLNPSHKNRPKIAAHSFRPPEKRFRLLLCDG